MPMVTELRQRISLLAALMFDVGHSSTARVMASALLLFSVSQGDPQALPLTNVDFPSSIAFLHWQKAAFTGIHLDAL